MDKQPSFYFGIELFANSENLFFLSRFYTLLYYKLINSE